MSAATADRSTDKSSVVLWSEERLAAADICYTGCAACFNAAGYLAPVTATSGDVFHGVFTEQCDNSAGSAGDLRAKVEFPVEAKWDCSGLAQSDIGGDCWLSDDHTVTTTPGNCYAGKITELVGTTECWVNHLPAARTASSWALADSSSAVFGTGSDVAVAWDGDSLNFIPATDNTGTIMFGNGTKDIDFEVFMGATSKYVLFDNSAAIVYFEDTDLHLGDNDAIEFGDAAGGDVTVAWNATNLAILPATDDTGAILVGDGTTDMDVKIFMGTAAKYVEFDSSAALLKLEDVDLLLGDDDLLKFGDGSDVTLTWNGTVLIITGLPASDPSVAGALYTDTNVVTVSAG